MARSRLDCTDGATSIITCVNEADEACKRAPMIHVHRAGAAIRAILGRIIILADPALVAPLLEHQRTHLRHKALARCASGLDVIVVLQPPEGQLCHRTPYVPEDDQCGERRDERRVWWSGVCSDERCVVSGCDERVSGGLVSVVTSGVWCVCSDAWCVWWCVCSDERCVVSAVMVSV